MLCEDFSDVLRHLQLLFAERSQKLQHTAPPTSRARLIKRALEVASRRRHVPIPSLLSHKVRASISTELSRLLETVPHKVASPQIQRLAAVSEGLSFPL